MYGRVPGGQADAPAKLVPHPRGKIWLCLGELWFGGAHGNAAIDVKMALKGGLHAADS
jgi:hypothetical protein